MSYLLDAEPRLDPPAYMAPECPSCREECEFYFLDINREIIACENCKEDGMAFDDVADAWRWTA